MTETNSESTLGLKKTCFRRKKCPQRHKAKINLNYEKIHSHPTPFKLNGCSLTKLLVAEALNPNTYLHI